MTLQKFDGKKLLYDTLWETAGCVLFSVGIHCFTAPNHIAPGGVTGLATLINYLWGFPIGTVSLLMNLPLLLLALRFLGTNFTWRTARTVVILTIVLDLLMPSAPAYTGDAILAALFGGVFTGAGLGLVFMRGSTTGGSDIACRLLQLRYPHMPVGQLVLLLDAAVLAASAVVYQNIETLLYGMITIYTSSQVIDRVLYGMDSGRLLIVMSEHTREIADQIIERVGRGVTFLDGEGAFSGKHRQVLLCAVRKVQYHKVKTIVNEIDPQAFFISTEASEILGYGFNPLNYSQK